VEKTVWTKILERDWLMGFSSKYVVSRPASSFQAFLKKLKLFPGQGCEPAEILGLRSDVDCGIAMPSALIRGMPHGRGQRRALSAQ
jgi:hypothetical protein